MSNIIHLNLNDWPNELPNDKAIPPKSGARKRKGAVPDAIVPSERSSLSQPPPKLRDATPLRSVSAALDVLREFGKSNQPIGVMEIARKQGLGKSHCSKLLATLRASGFLQQDPVTRLYSVGIEAFALGVQYVRNHELARVALPIMRHVADVCGCSTTLSVLHDLNIMHIQIVEGALTREGRLRTGVWIPFHASSAGRIILSRRSEDELERLFQQRPLERFTEQTVVNVADLIASLRRARKDGYAITRGQTLDGSAAIAVPIFDSEQKICASLGILLPEHLSGEEEALTLLGPLRDGAREMSLRNGALNYPYAPQQSDQSNAEL